MQKISAGRATGFWPALVTLSAAGAFATVAGAQATHVSGRVTDAVGAPIIEAHVGVDGMAATTLTDSLGRFRIAGVPAGEATIRARRLGFRPTSASLIVPAGGVDGVAIRLTALPTVLTPVPVRVRGTDFSGRLAGYYDRLARGGHGHFITRDRIDRENPRMLTQLLERLPGVSSNRLRAGGRGVRLRGRNCWPLVWIDGTPMPAGEVDLDAFPPSSLHGIEVYLGSTGAPMKYTHVRDMSSCGTILLWSRGPDTDPVVRTPRTSTYLEQLVANSSIFTADKVDAPARLRDGQELQVTYPQSLLAAKVGGVVIAEYVIGFDGRVEPGTFGIVSSPHPLFTEAVRQAVSRAAYAPATRQGSSVRQLVQQPFEFSPESPRSGDGAAAGGVAKRGS
jgi:TonB family protein